MKIAIIGDVHGHFDALRLRLEQLRDKGVEAALQVGDFGFYRHLMDGPDNVPEPFAMPIHAVCGNHEDHAWLRSRFCESALARWAEAGLHYQPRGSYLELGGCGIGFIGGSLNIDQPQVGWWFTGSTNYITRGQAKKAVKYFNDKKPPLLISHSSPARIGIGMYGNPELREDLERFVISKGYDAGPQNDAGETALTWLWQNLTYRPRVWGFGHFHYYHHAEIEGTDFYSASNVEDEEPILIWDTLSRSVSLLRVAALDLQDPTD